MKKIVYQNNLAFIYYNKQFYNQQTITTATKQYTNFINYTITQLGKYHILKLTLKPNHNHSLKTLTHEISNYILAQQHQTQTN